MKNKSYDQAYLDKFFKRFKNKDEIFRALCTNVGYVQLQSLNNSPPSFDPTRLAPSGVAVNVDSLEAADFVKSSFTDRQRVIDHTAADNNKTTTFWHITGVTGLGQLLDLPKLFISISPEEASKENYVHTPYQWHPSTEERAELEQEITNQVLAAPPRPPVRSPAAKGPTVAAAPAAAGAPAEMKSEPELEEPLEEGLTAEQKRDVHQRLENRINELRSTKEGEAEYAVRVEHAKRHAVKMFKNIAGKSPGKPIIGVLVGKGLENKLAIVNSSTVDANFNVPSVSHLRWQNESFPASNVYGIQAHFVEVYDFLHDDNHPSLSTQAFDTLYDIYKKTLGNTTDEGTADPNPVVFISKNGLDRGPKFAFAFYLLSKFDEIFLTAQNRPELNKLVLAAFETFRRSHSPVALSNVEDVKQALYIAWGLKMVEMQNDCVYALLKTLGDNKNDVDFAGRGAKINQILAALNEQTQPLTVRFSYIQSKIAADFPALSTRHKFTVLDYVPGVPKPVYYNQLKELAQVINLRIQVEEQILPALGGQQAPGNEHDGDNPYGEHEVQGDEERRLGGGRR